MDDDLEYRIHNILQNKINSGNIRNFAEQKHDIGGVLVGGRRPKAKKRGPKKSKYHKSGNPWLIFLAAFRKELKKQGVQLSPQDVLHEASQQYQNIVGGY